MKPPLIAIVAGSIGVATGVIVGYKIAEKKLSVEFDERLQKETAGMREFYQVAKKPFATPQEAASALVQNGSDPEESTVDQANMKVAYHKIVKKNYDSEESEEELAVEAEPGPEDPLRTTVEQNLFEDGAPRIITQEEFMTNESQYVQGNLTYYQSDSVLSDERDDVIEDQDATVGVKNLTMFGHPNSGSSDANIIHIRNPRLQMEFEICRSNGSYRREVLQIDDDPPQRPSGRDR
jgi:hypothetical protein